MENKIMTLVSQTRVLRMAILYLLSVYFFESIEAKIMFFALAFATSYKHYWQFVRVPIISKGYKILYGIISLLMNLSFIYGTFDHIQTNILNKVIHWGLFSILLIAILVGITYYYKLLKKNQLDKAFLLSLVDLYGDVLLFFAVFLCTV